MRDRKQIHETVRTLREQARAAQTIGELRVVTEQAIELVELLGNLNIELTDMVFVALQRAQTVMAGEREENADAA